MDTADSCIRCYENSVLIGTGCRCNSALTRNPTTLHCEKQCPTGFTHSFDNFCEEISSTMAAVSFNFSVDGPWTSVGTSSEVVGDHCMLPHTVPERGVFFDAKASISLEMFYIHSSYTFTLWARPMTDNIALLSYEYTLWEGWDQWERT
jgi:hypothetical protein